MYIWTWGSDGPPGVPRTMRALTNRRQTHCVADAAAGIRPLPRGAAMTTSLPPASKAGKPDRSRPAGSTLSACFGFFDFFFDESFSLGFVVALAAISCSPICAGLVVCNSFVINMSQYEVRQVTSASPGSPPAQCRVSSLTDAAVVYPADWFKANLLDIENWCPRE